MTREEGGATGAAAPDTSMGNNGISSAISIAMLEAALAYARQGFRIFPVHSVNEAGVCSCGGVPGCSPGKHPRTARGYKAATTDPEQINQWWTRWPDANIGISCKDSGLLVIDVDTRSGGHITLSALEKVHGPLPATLTALTGLQNGGRGRHYFFQAPPGKVRIKGQLGQGIDLKYNGYVLAAPSRHVSGVRYEWVHPEAAPARLPKWVSELVILRAPPVNVRRHVSSFSESIADKYGLQVSDYLMPVNPHQMGDEIRGASPVHGSTTGQNLCINTKKNTWFCFRCQVGGGPVEALAVARGIIPCHQAGKSCLDGHWQEIFAELEKDGHKTENDREIEHGKKVADRLFRRHKCQN